ncbi:ABC transporter substrate-binding protein [Pedobacter sp. HMF7647]|uniref:histidine kinase n=1 Tax=Hufsiella arboris TaxID=2695275 RepID=A0A7K1Y911_9SPHI|nr:ABC transporter substrate-binding protein [Hufsiella arboris]MXV51082.1 ABC transporter substrate-binding protein [Hufsiella arboris]
MNLRVIWLFFLLIFFSSVTVVSASLPVVLQLNNKHGFEFAGYYAALKKGFYKREDLQVTLIQERSGRSPIDEVISTRADFGITGSDILPARISGKPVIVLSVIFQHSPARFFALQSSGIKKMKDMAGKRVIISQADEALFLKAIFLQDSVSAKNVGISVSSWNNMSLNRGEGDAILSFDVDSKKLLAKGIGLNVIKPVNNKIDFYGDLIFTSESMLQNNPKVAEKFVKASLDGWQYALSHREEIIEYILTLPGIKQRGITAADLRKEADQVNQHILPNLVEIGHVNNSRWQEMLNTLVKLNLVNKNVRLDGFVYDSAYQREEIFKLLLYIIIAISAASIIAIVWNSQLRKQVKLRTDELIREIEQRYATEQSMELAVDAAGLAFWEWNLETSQIRYKGHIAKMGYGPDVKPRNLADWHKIIHPDDLERVNKAEEEIQRGLSSSGSITYRLLDVKEGWKWVLSVSKIASYNEQHLPLTITGIHVDVSSLKNRETELNELTKELLKKNAELETFAFITSHNFRAPVANLKSLVKLYDESDLDAETKESLFDNIRSSIDNLDETLNDLSEIISSKSNHNVQREILNIEKELSRVLRSIDSQLKESGAGIDWDLNAPSVYFSRQYFHSIFLNLLTNAFKYRLPNGELKILIRSFKDDGFTVISFSDNGRGIDLSKFGAKLFGLYQRFHHDTDGKGLGLYITKSQIESLDGKITIDSEVGKGTVFNLYFRNA